MWLVGRLPAAHLRRAVPQPRRPERDDEARAGAHRRADDGRLVPRDLGRQLHRRRVSSASTSRCRCQRSSATSRSSASSRAFFSCRVAPWIKRLMGRIEVVAWRSKSTSRSATSRARRSRPATRRSRRAREEGDVRPGALLLRAEAPRQPSALRLPPRAQGRAAVVGRAEGAVARSQDEAARDARRGSSDRVRHVRRRHPGRLRRRHRHALGSGHVDAADRRRRRGAEEGRPEVHARRLQAQRIVGARADRRPVGRRRRAKLAADQAQGRLGRRRRHHRVRAAAASRASGDFEDILAADKPDVWVSNRPAKGGETGAMLDEDHREAPPR